MKIEHMQIIIPHNVGELVIIGVEMSEDQIERYRRMITGNLEMFGFSNVEILFTYHNCPGEITPIDAIQVQQMQVIPDVQKSELAQSSGEVELTQYRKVKSIMDFFKKK